jgi:hypothetical protein
VSPYLPHPRWADLPRAVQRIGCQHPVAIVVTHLGDPVVRSRCPACNAEWMEWPPAEVPPDFDLIDQLAGMLRTEICDRAAVWDENFDAGPGLVVSVSDAARVAARAVLETAAIRALVSARGRTVEAWDLTGAQMADARRAASPEDQEQMRRRLDSVLDSLAAGTIELPPIGSWEGL